jgi:Niemann-Pick C1 protein
VIAFFVGSNTILPGLESFCIYAAVAIFAIYVMQVTHFVAWMSLGKNFHAFFSKNYFY